MSKLTVGSDLEFFVTSGSSMHAKSLIAGEVICPFGKDDPRELSYGRMHWDNVCIEICPEHADNVDDFHKNVVQMMGAMTGDIAKAKCHMARYASAYISQALASSPSAQVFGCEPDLNAHTRKVQRPNAKSAGTLRTAGGHVHIGVETESMEDKILLTKLCDMYLGIPSVMLDDDTRRRELYGKAGSFRPKDYGIEYRTLSNYWALRDNTIKWIFEQVQEVVSVYEGMKVMQKEDSSGIDYDWMDGSVSAEIQEIINTGNRRKARAYIKASNINMP